MLKLRSSVAVLAVLGALAVPAAADEVVTRSGRTVDLAPYEKVTIRLVECRSCGYQWHVTSPFKQGTLKRLSDRYVAPSNAGGVVGGAGKRVVVYRAVRPGRWTLRMSYVGPDGTVAKRFRLTARITAR
jgi:predicted secreted protein